MGSFLLSGDSQTRPRCWRQAVYWRPGGAWPHDRLFARRRNRGGCFARYLPPFRLDRCENACYDFEDFVVWDVSRAAWDVSRPPCLLPCGRFMIGASWTARRFHVASCRPVEPQKD